MASATEKAAGNPLIRYFKDFAVLKETRSEYWGIQVINLLDSTVFFAVLTIAVVLLSEDFGFTDIDAGYAITVYASGTTISLLFAGVLTDWLGIRRSFFLAMAGQMVTRGAIIAAFFLPDLPQRNLIVWVGFLLMAPFVAMVQTVYQAANKRFTTRRSRSAGFNLWYLFMNIGAALGGWSIDVVRKTLGMPNIHIFTMGVLLSAVCIVLTFFLVRREDQLYGPDEEPEPAEPVAPTRRTPLEIAKAVLGESVFWRFVALISLLLGVRAVFLYMHLLMPKFWLRVIGPDAAIGALEAVNPVLVVIGLILLIPILHRFSVYKMLVFGSMISAASLFFLAWPAWGQTVYWTSLASLAVLTVGEVIWSPRLTEYTAAIAPKGQEGTYLGLSMVPYFLAKTVVSLLSGHMLVRWVPEAAEGQPILRDRLAAGEIAFWDSPSAMWLILGAVALAGPILALVFRGWFTRGAKWGDGSAAEAAVEAAAAPEAEAS